MRSVSLAILAPVLAGAGLPVSLAAQCQMFEDEGVVLQDSAYFATSVDVDGGRAVVGDYSIGDSPGGTGKVHVYSNARGPWSLEATVDQPQPGDESFGSEFGFAVALEGERLAVGQPGSSLAAGPGELYVFRFDGAMWTQEAKVGASDSTAGDGFGRSVTMSGDWIAAANQDRTVYFLERVGGTWVEQQSVQLDQESVSPVVRVEGDVAVIGAPGEDSAAKGAGAAYVYRREPSGWLLDAKLVPPGLHASDGFGSAVAVSGDLALLGASGDDEAGQSAGAAYVYRRGVSGWMLDQKLLLPGAAPFDRFGHAVALHGNRALVTAVGHDGAGEGLGGVFGFLFDGTEWLLDGALQPQSQPAFDGLGRSVARDAETAWVGSSGGPAGRVYAFAVGGDDCDGDGTPDVCHVPSESTRLGEPPNPHAFLPGQTSGPRIGSTWDPVIDHTEFVRDSTLDFAGVSLQPLNLPSAYGTLLCDPSAPLWTYSGAPAAPLQIKIPDECALAGTPVCAQGGSMDARGDFFLANALDAVLGF
ncbi:MAG: FG-GAP repeat protein [Planctomycetota bacterium]